MSAAVGSALRFNVRRANYAQPLTITQIIHGPGGATVRRPLPGWTVKSWDGLHRFLRITVRNTAGKLVASQVGPFCPDSYNAQRSNPNSPRKSPFPQACQGDPFQLSNAWGIQRGWGVDGAFIAPRLRLGRYTVTVHIIRFWQRVLHLTPRTSTAMVKIKVVKPRNCGPFQPCAARPANRYPVSRGSLAELPANVPTVTRPPAASLPDLVPLPSWGIRVFHFRTPTGDHRTSRAGTMGFDDKPGHTHWHFQQFAQYRLLNKAKTNVVRSRKVGFCT